MVDTFGPVNAVAGSPSYTGRKLRQLSSPFVAGATSARPLGARSGVRPGTPSTTVTVSGSTWTCQAFAGVIDAQTAAEAGPYEFAFDASTTGSVDAAHATLQRVDGLYVQIDDPAESDGTSTPAVRRLYLANPSAGTGAPPASPPARSFRIARIIVPASGGGSPTVVFDPPYAVGAGGVLPSTSKALLPASGDYVGQYAEVFADTTSANNGLYRWSGSVWVQWTGSGTDAAGWDWVLQSGKKSYRKFFAAWSGSAFGATGGANYVQARDSGIAVPTGRNLSDFHVSVDLFAASTTNSLQPLLVGYLSVTTGTASFDLLFANPTAISIPNTNMNMQATITLTEK